MPYPWSAGDRLTASDLNAEFQAVLAQIPGGGTYNPASVSITGGSINNTPLGASTAASGAFTTLSASGVVSGTGFSTYLASPPGIGSTTPASGAFTTLSANSTVSGTGFSTYLASPPAIGATTPNTGKFTTLTLTGALSGAAATFTTLAASSTSTAPTVTSSDSSTNIATSAMVQGRWTNSTSIATTGGSTTLTASQYNCSLIVATGTLISNATFVVPNNGLWTVYNNTSGAFSLTVKTAAGSGVTVTQGQTDIVVSNGTNVLMADSDMAGSAITASTINSTTIGATTPSTGAFTTLSATSTVSGTGFSTYLASPPAIGSTAPSTGAFTTLSASGTVSGTGFTTLLSPYLTSSTAASTYAPLASPALSGSPTSTTQATTDSSTNIATTAMVQGRWTNSTNISTTGGSTTLTASQYNCALILITGTLASNATLVVPNNGLWTVANNTTGAFTVTVKTSAGTGVTVTQGQTDAVVANGTNVLMADSDMAGSIITASTINSTSVGATTPSTGAFTTLSATSTVSGAGFNAWAASPPAIGSTAPASGAFTTLSASGAITGSSTLTTAGTIKVATTASDAVLLADSPIANSAQVYHRKGGVNRWITGANSTTEGGSNAGSDYAIQAYSDTGTSLGTYLSIARSSGAATFSGPVTAAGGAFTTLSASSTVSGAGFTSLLSPYLTSSTAASTYATIASVPAASSTSPSFPSTTASVGSGTTYARADHGHASDQPAVATVAALRLVTSITLPASRCILRGYTANADGGEGLFVVNAGDTTSSDNGGTIIVDASSRRWYRTGGGNVLLAGWFGCIGDGTTDNAAALNRALAVLSGTGGKIQFGPGKFKFASNVSFTYPAGHFAVTIEGSGQDSTILYWPSGTGGLTFGTSSPYHSIHIRNMSLTTGTTNGGNAIAITNSFCGGAYEQSDFSNLTIRGDDNGGATDYWGNGIYVCGQANINYINCLLYGAGSGAAANGTGVLVFGNVASTNTGFNWSIVHNFIGCGFYNHSVGFNYGTYVQGVTFANCNWTNGATGVYAPAGIVSPAQLTLTSCQLNCSANSVNIAAGFPGIQLLGNLIYVASGGAGIAMTGVTSQTSIVGNVFSTATGSVIGNGISISAGAQAIISGNSFYKLINGVFLGASSSGVTVLGNTYSGNTANVGNSGAGNSVGVATS